MILLDGKLVSAKVLESVKEKIGNENIKAKLAIVLAGNFEPSKIYVNSKIKACKEVGIEVELIKYDDDVSEEELITKINELNADEAVNGILVQSPLPGNLDFDKIINLIDPKKDIDGLNSESVYANYMNKKGFLPCTVKGIIKLFEYYNIDLTGKKVTIIGKGNLVGKPLVFAITNLGATVTLCHSKTVNLPEHTRSADIIISATGIMQLVSEDMVSESAVVIDVGIIRVDGKIKGDVDFETVKNKASYITPVPGGVGPMTVAMIMENVVDAYNMQNK